MIRIYLNNTLLDVEQSLTIEKNSPWFSSDQLIGEFSYPISGPMTPRNKALLYGASSKEVLLDADGIYIKKCTLKYKASKDSFSGFLKLDLATIVTNLKKKLRELITTTVSFTPSELVSIQSTLGLYNQREIGTVPICFPVIKNTAFIDSEAVITEDALSNYITTPYLNYSSGPSVELDTSLRQGYHVVPQVFLTWLLKELISNLGFEPIGELFADPDIKTWILCNNVALDWQVDSRERYEVTISNHLPDITMADFLKALRLDESVGLFVDNAAGTMELKRLTKTLGSGTTLDLTGTELVGWEYETPDFEGYKILANIDDDDEMYKLRRHTASLSIKTAEEEIELEFGTMLMTTEEHPTSEDIGNWVIPEIRQPGNTLNRNYETSEIFIETQNGEDFKPKNETSLLLLSYKGMQYGTGILNYALATSLQANAQGDTLGTRTTRFDGATGRFYESIERYYGFLAVSRPISAKMLIPASKLPALSISEKILLNYDNAPRKYFIKQIRFEFPIRNGKVPATADLLEISLRDTVSQQAIVSTLEVWVSVELENFTIVGDSSGSQEKADVYIKAWLDAAKTIPADVEGLTVYYKSVASSGYFESTTEEFTELMNSASQLVATQTIVFTEELDGQGEARSGYRKEYSITKDPAYNT